MNKTEANPYLRLLPPPWSYLPCGCRRLCRREPHRRHVKHAVLVPALHQHEAVLRVQAGVELGLREVQGHRARGVLQGVLAVLDLREFRYGPFLGLGFDYGRRWHKTRVGKEFRLESGIIVLSHFPQWCHLNAQDTGARVRINLNCFLNGLHLRK